MAGSSHPQGARAIICAAVFAGLLAAVAALALSCSDSNGGRTASTAGGTRTSEAGSVTVEISWDGPESGPVFAVSIDTHSVDLDGFDLTSLVTLQTDSGVDVTPSGWDAPKGGHHRSGTLSFPALFDGRPILGDDVRRVTLVVRDVASPERRFEWTW